MSPAQTSLYWREFQYVRKVKPDADRHQLHVEALGRAKSSKDFTNHDLDLVLGVFRSISRPASMTSQLRQIGQRRERMLYKIGEHIRCLALYVPNAQAYADAILKERFKASSLDELGDHPTIQRTRNGDIEKNAPLLQYLMTLAGRENALRKKAGHTLHAMKTQDGVTCECAACVQLAPQEPDTLPDSEAVETVPVTEDAPF